MHTRRFLESVAQTFAEEADLDGTRFVFPNRRAALFFHKALTEGGASRTIHSATLDDVMAACAGLRPATRVHALTVLRGCWNDVTGEDVSLDAFLTWGDALLSDLDDLCAADIHMASLPHDLEAYLAAMDTPAAAGLLASLRAHGDGGAQRNIETLFPRLASLQTLLRDRLAAEGLATAGTMQMEAAMKARQPYGEITPAIRRYVFVGLGRLTPCHRAVLTRLQREGRALFFWDYAGEAVTDPDGGGSILAENIALFPQADGFAPEAAAMKEQHWGVIHVPSATTQAAYAAQEIEKALAAGYPEDDIAVVVSDAALLRPVLDALPEGVRRVNVTMGQPLADSGVAALVDTLLEMAHTFRKKPRSRGAAAEEGTLYYKPVLAVLHHPLVRRATAAAAEAEAAIAAAGRPYLREDDVVLGDATLERLFGPAYRATDVPTWIMDVILALQGTATDMEREYMAAYHAMAADLAAGLDESLPADTWRRLLRRGAAVTALPFEGEPLQGLQVIGALEMRCLDFDTVIYVGAAEGLLPAAGARPTLLPQTLRAALGLPTPASQETTAEYHFWRSTCRAERVTLIHDCRTDGMRSGEETRYAKQLRHLYGIVPEETTAPVTIDPAAMAAPVRMKAKDDAVMRILKEKFIDGSGAFSASSINTYLTCRLRYWWECVLGVRDDDDIVENPDAALLGTVFHAVMEALYKPLRGRALQKEDILSLDNPSAVGMMTEDAFRENGIHDLDGRNAILRDVVVRLVSATLAADAQSAPLTVLGTERSAAKTVTLPRSGLQVRLYGKIDRMDRTADGTRRVVDYKSGTVKNRDDIRDPLRPFDRSLGGRRPHVALQILLYALLTEDGDGIASPCIYSTREIFGARPKAASVTPAALAAFSDALLETIDEIFDPAVPFSANDDDDTCDNCPFKTICNRI